MARHPNREPVKHQDVVREYLQNKRNVVEIAELLGVSKQRIDQILRKYDVPRRPRGRPLSYDQAQTLAEIEQIKKEYA